MRKTKVGRPPKYNTPEEMQKIIDEYFKSCEGKAVLDDDGVPMRDKFGYPIYDGAKPPTICGLALALGFNSRQSLLNYQDKDEFVDTITRAKSRVEEYVEGRLFDRDGVNGAKFCLINNFKGWKEKGAMDDSEGDVVIVDDV